MTYTNAVAVAFVAADGVIDKLELELGIPGSDRDFLAAYQTKLASASTSRGEDQRAIGIFLTWAIMRHRITA